RPNRLFCGVSEVRSESLAIHKDNGFQYFVWNNKRILWIKDKKADLPKNIAFDYLIIANNSITTRQLKDLRFEKLILDSSNSKWYTDRLTKEWNGNNVFSVSDQGAFIEKTEL
ncbi:MAG TPA: hypothetical protein VIT44_17365, partial [Cyclobacteriaceae bacterium]